MSISLLLSLLCSSCIEDISDCVRGNGDIIEVAYNFEPIHEIIAWDGLEIILHQSSEQSVVVKAGKNILPDIHFSMEEGTLHIKDKNTCNWTKAYEKREVHIYINHLKSIHQNGYGLIQSADTLHAENLSIKARIGSGDIDLILNTEELMVESSRYGTISLKGKTTKLMVSYLDNNAIFDGRDFVADHIKIFHKSNNDFHLQPVHSLRGKLLKRGNAYVYHTPKTVEVLDTGRGNIIYYTQ